MDAPFKECVLRTALRACKRRGAPGPDWATTQMLQNLPDSQFQKLLSSFNDIWASSEFPAVWRLAWVVPVLKSGKPVGDLSSYRPVSLSSCFPKLFERLVHAHFIWGLGEHHLFSSNMTGFRSRLSAQDSILHIVNAVQHAVASRMSTVAALFDIQAAFDKVEPASVLTQVTSLGVTGRVQGFLEGFLSNRSIQVKLGNSITQSRPVHRGLPQGSVLSPPLFNIAIAGLPAALPNSRIPIVTSMYADDLCIWVSGFRHPTVRVIMQSAINKIQAFLESQGLSISGHKAAAMVFPGRNRRLREVKLQLEYSQPLRLVSKHCFLGITLKNRCKWHHQVKALTASTISFRNAVRRVGVQNWGNSPRSMLTLHFFLVVR
ncbi:hypothetical protein HPB47_014187 [Ixodes persulcatus]|uniref:Uncharacterized protein n=1 Tax=Ixodes persulcatus TaxID=34615 RepID=A0AC60R0S9_IXOPE|nr:hypothetical protein HPB47_014187 [Ixodes persulcatus]